MPQLIPPVPGNDDVTDASWQQFCEKLRKQSNAPVFFAQTTDPGTGGVPSGTWAVWKNTTSGIVKLWVNDGGIMKSVTIT
jgi:hypothetical protein